MLNNQFIVEKFGFSDEAFIAEFHEKALTILRWFINGFLMEQQSLESRQIQSRL